MFKDHQKYLDKILDNESVENWENILKLHKEMVAIIQHERLIHLLVTFFVGVVMSMSFIATIITEKAYLLFLDIPLLFLFTGYLFHYRYLENTTQKWYPYTNQIRKRLKKQ